MKIRARLGTTTKVVVIEDDVANFVQISELRILIQNAFGSLLDQPFKMGLIKTEPFANEEATIGECEIVHCDLIHVITENPIPVVEAKKIRVQDKRESSTKKLLPSCSKEVTVHQPFEPMSLGHISAYMDKVLFCYDSTGDRVPEQLEMLLHSSSATSCQELVIVILHQLLMESGFQFATNVTNTESGNPEEVPTNLSEIFTSQRSQSFYRLFYIHPDYEGVTIMLICIPMLLKMLVIQGKLLNFPLPKENPPELIINSENFINQVKTDSAASVYKNLRILSADFKDSVALRLLIEMKIALGIPGDSGFLGLFSEIQLKILKYLDLRSLVKVSLVCKDLYEKSRDSSLWRRMFAIHKTITFDGVLSEDWFDNFKRLYKYIRLQPRRRILHPRITPSSFCAT